MFYLYVFITILISLDYTVGPRYDDIVYADYFINTKIRFFPFKYLLNVIVLINIHLIEFLLFCF